MIKKITSYVAVALGLNGIFVSVTYAHCPLCTVGAGAAAIAADWLGFSPFSIGIFLGAFALAVGLWMDKLLRRKKIKFPFQTPILGIVSFLTTILPLQPILFDNSSIYISLYGDYGTWLNSTYFFDKFLAGSIIGAIILVVSPYLSKAISKARKDKTFPYQGMALTFCLLLITALSFEIIK